MDSAAPTKICIKCNKNIDGRKSQKGSCIQCHHEVHRSCLSGKVSYSLVLHIC
jgi:hypothetical protein